MDKIRTDNYSRNRAYFVYYHVGKKKKSKKTKITFSLKDRAYINRQPSR